jgi:hypothetical protein
MLTLITMDQKVKVKGKVVPVLLAKHHAMKVYCGSGDIAPCILDLGTRWKWLISFMHWPLYPQGKSPGTLWIDG